MSLADLQSLAGKYLTLAQLRRAKTDGRSPPEREFFKDLARKFPSALSELDRLPLAEIDARGDALARAASGSIEPEEWMYWLHDYHALWRVALALRLRNRKNNAHPVDQATLLKMQRVERVSFSSSFVQSVKAPPHGRLMLAVIHELDRKYGERSNGILVDLFPRLQKLRTAPDAT